MEPTGTDYTGSKVETNGTGVKYNLKLLTGQIWSVVKKSI